VFSDSSHCVLTWPQPPQGAQAGGVVGGVGRENRQGHRGRASHHAAHKRRVRRGCPFQQVCRPWRGWVVVVNCMSSAVRFYFPHQYMGGFESTYGMQTVHGVDDTSRTQQKSCCINADWQNFGGDGGNSHYFVVYAYESSREFSMWAIDETRM